MLHTQTLIASYRIFLMDLKVHINEFVGVINLFHTIGLCG
jgi:hypothetical protein